MAEKLEDLNLPNTTVTKIIKEVLPDHVILAKDAKAALSRAASVFILYVTSQASNEAQKGNRKTLMGTDVIKALEELEFDNFIEPLEQLLKDTKEAKQKKKSSPGKAKKDNAENDIEEIEDTEEEPMEEVETGD